MEISSNQTTDRPTGIITEVQDASVMSQLAQLAQENARYRTWIEKMLTVCESAGRGDLEPRVLGLVNDQSELGRLARGINQMLDVTDAFVRESRASLAFASKGKFFRRLVLRGMPGSFRAAAAVINGANDEMANKAAAVKAAETQKLKLADSFEETVKGVIGKVGSSAAEMRTTAEGLATSASKTSDQVNAVAAASEETSANVRTVAAAVEELTSSMGEITRQVVDAANIANNAVQESNRTRTLMLDLSEASTRIGRVVQIIAKLAGTTNLLALNATIESARAGEAGKGFAVVASEVKDLAKQTAAATEEIEREIQAIQTKTKTAVSAISVVGETIERINKISGSISVSIEEQRSATGEISSNIHEASQATQEVSKNVTGVSAAVVQTSTAASLLLNAADGLTLESDRLSAVADSFVVSIRKG